VSVYKIKKTKKKISSSKDLQEFFQFYQLTCKPLLCSPNQKKIIIETQFNPVASHHLNLLEKKYLKNILRRSFAKNSINLPKILF